MAITLFPHQVEAVQWMQRTECRPRLVPEQPHGGILAHAMGLGKTMTMLALMKQQGLHSTIVVCPKSVLHQWRDEALRVLDVPHDKVILYHGPHRHAALADSDPSQRLVLTTFDLVRLDCKLTATCSLHAHHWDRIILDEAHRICEQSSKTAKAIRSLKAKNRWCVTGTPFKNGVTDLVALSKFLMVPPYCNSTWWRCHSHNRHKMKEWRQNFLHMQDKSVLALPDVLHVTTHTPKLEVEQQVTHQLQQLVPLHEFETAEADAKQEHELLKIMRLRQAANHPVMLANSLTAMRHLLMSPTITQPAGVCDACRDTMPRKRRATTVCDSHELCDTCCQDVFACPCCIAEGLPVTHCPTGVLWRHSGKTQALWQYLSKILGEASTKVVLFSQWTTCLDLLAMMLECMGVQYARFDGRVNSIDERGDIINVFRDDTQCPILLTSLGAGGEGLNLIFANHVVLMEPYWNCAAEQQAIDRLHRIGQKKVTHVLRLFSQDSIEDWVQVIQRKKTKELERLLCGKECEDSSAPKEVFRAMHAAPPALAGTGLSQFLAPSIKTV